MAVASPSCCKEWPVYGGYSIESRVIVSDRLSKEIQHSSTASSIWRYLFLTDSLVLKLHITRILVSSGCLPLSGKLGLAPLPVLQNLMAAVVRHLPPFTGFLARA